MNKKAIFEELKAAIDEDKLHWLRNDVKIAAVGTAKSYEEFQQRVAAAHLQPLKKEDKSKKYRNWNTLASNTENN